jgi:hypothetical protein
MCLTGRREVKRDMSSVAEACRQMFASTYFEEEKLTELTITSTALTATPSTAADEGCSEATLPRPEARLAGSAQHVPGGKAKRKAVLIAQDARVARALQETVLHRRPSKAHLVASSQRLSSSCRS